MDSHGKSKKAVITVLCWVLVCTIFQGCFADVPHFWNNSPSHSGSSIAFSLKGNVYPLGHFVASLNIGQAQKAFELDIDTGSDLTWVECDPCKRCRQPPERRYKPNKGFVSCKDRLCALLSPSERRKCKSADDRCEYEVHYLDGTTSIGALVEESFLGQSVAFGCGYDQVYPLGLGHPSSGLLGLGRGKVSILSQLSSLGAIRNVLGHCLSARSGGFLFFGADYVPPSGITWVPMLAGASTGKYKAGPAQLFHKGIRDIKPIGGSNIQVEFDCGTTYTYFERKLRRAVVDQIWADLEGKDLEQTQGEKGFALCWKRKDKKPIQSLNELKNFFMPFSLSFMKMGEIAELPLPPEAYLIITNLGDVCFGILEAGKSGVPDSNVIGEISMQDIMVIYDNENKHIGWMPNKCDNPPKP